ncbi:hypothetical protein CW304_02740 [Bacillus sp. UFRGS-B20]|nr:hypothetical protein CW304_02740 [Bacillus sp. UFRGS-B20]
MFILKQPADLVTLSLLSSSKIPPNQPFPDVPEETRLVYSSSNLKGSFSKGITFTFKTLFR